MKNKELITTMTKTKSGFETFIYVWIVVSLVILFGCVISALIF